jgi:hypothetical protein
MSAYTKTGNNSSIDYTLNVEVDKVVKHEDNAVRKGCLILATSEAIARKQALWMPKAKDGKVMIDTALFIEICREVGTSENKGERKLAGDLLESINSGEITWEAIEKKSQATAKELGIKPIASRDHEGLFVYLVAKASAIATKESNPLLRNL